MEEMIEKQITLLIPKSQEEFFNKLIEGFEKFTLEEYLEEEDDKWKVFSMHITSNQLKQIKA